MGSYAFATVEDYAERQIKPLSDGELALAGLLLDDAGLFLRRYVVLDEDDAEQAALLKAVSCSMVKRAMNAENSDAFGMAEQTIKADIYSQTARWANPNGDLYLTAAEKRLLGITSSYVIGIRPEINPVKVDHANLWRDS